MAKSDITLTCPSVNGGNIVELNGVSINYGWTNLTNSQPVNGKWDITEVGVAGLDNPVMTITGVIDVDAIKVSTTNPATGNTLITQKLLQNFAKVLYTSTDSSTYITLDVYTGGNTISGGSAVAQTKLLASDGTTGTIRIVIENFSIQISTDIQNGQRWNYTVVVRETA